MDYDNDSLHFDLSSQTKAGRQRISVSRDLNLGRVLHDCISAVYLKFLRSQPQIRHRNFKSKNGTKINFFASAHDFRSS